MTALSPTTEEDARLAASQLTTSLLLAEVVPGPGWDPHVPPVSLRLGLAECCLLEGLAVQPADLLLRTAATLAPPVAGRLYHWGRDLVPLPRRRLYPWRRRLAFISPGHSLLPRLTLEENLNLSQVLTTQQRLGDVAQRHGSLLTQLGLTPYLRLYPRQLPPREYQLALWARELVKEPRLILGVLAGQEELYGIPELIPRLFPFLAEYHQNRRGAILLAGPWLAPAYGLADRRLVLQADRWQTESLPRRHPQPLAAYLKIL